MAAIGCSLQFAKCQFDHAEFRYCVFANSAFSENIINEPVVTECDFTNTKADAQWWPATAQTDVFVSYLNLLIAEILGTLGPKSVAAGALSIYRNGYTSGENASKDYSACLYNGDVSNQELDVVEDIINRIGPQFDY
jgi:uncharacterized protein YjbI with pentapeptide repeats